MGYEIEFVAGGAGIESYVVTNLGRWIQQDSVIDHKYAKYKCFNVPETTIFTIFQQFGLLSHSYKICEVSSSWSKDEAEIGPGYCKGNYNVIVNVEGQEKVERLIGWWNRRPESPNLHWLYAQHCADYIDEGVELLPPLSRELIEKAKHGPRLDPDEVSVILKILLRMPKDEFIEIVKGM